MSNNAIHPDFKLNGISFTNEVLKDVAYSYVKEGGLHEIAIGHFLLDWLDASPTVQVHTSGSTGLPKPMVLQKRQMVNSALATGQFFGLKAGDSALLCLSAGYIAGKMMLVRAMVLGLYLDCMTPNSNPLKENSKNYDFGAMVPLQVKNSLEQIGKIKTLLVGGAPLTPKLKQELKTSRANIFETYGMTETITHIAVKKVTDNSITNDKEEPFKALPNVKLSIDPRNCLVIAAPKVSDEQVVTNDVVELVSETEFKWLGRYDNVINSGGIKLFPERIEEKLAAIIDQRFFVTGLPDEKFGQKLVLVLEGETDSDALWEKLTTLSSLQAFEIPKAIRVLPQFLQTETGKIQRQKNIDLLRS